MIELDSDSGEEVEEMMPRGLPADVAGISERRERMRMLARLVREDSPDGSRGSPVGTTGGHPRGGLGGDLRMNPGENNGGGDPEALNASRPMSEQEVSKITCLGV